MQTAKVSDYRTNLATLHSKVIKNHNPLMVSGRGGDVVIIAADDYENILETIHILKDKTTINSLMNVRKQINQNSFSGQETQDAFKDLVDVKNK